MRSIFGGRALRAALTLATTLAIAAGVGSAAASTDSGYRDIQDFASASFQTRVSDCLFADASVGYAAGDNLQTTLGSGMPGSWADAQVRVSVFDSCDNDAEVWRAEGLGFPDDGPDFDRLDRASLDVTLVTLADALGRTVDAEIHLEWMGNDDTTVRIDHQLDGGYFRQERSETATVTGTVEFTASPFWSSLTLTGVHSHDVVIGTANEIALP